MVPTGKLTPSGGTEDPQKAVDKPDSTPRPVAPAVGDERKGKPFREVLDKKLSQKDEKKATTTALNSEDEEEVLSPFDLVAQKPIRKVILPASTPDLLEETDTPEYIPVLNADGTPKIVKTVVGVATAVPTTEEKEETPIDIQSKVTTKTPGEGKILGEEKIPEEPKIPGEEKITEEGKKVVLPEQEKSKIVAYNFTPVKDTYQPVKLYGENEEVLTDDELLTDTEIEVDEEEPKTSKVSDMPTSFVPVESKKNSSQNRGDIAYSDEPDDVKAVIPEEKPKKESTEVAPTAGPVVKEKEKEIPKIKDVDIPQINIAAGQTATIVPINAPVVNTVHEPVRAREILIQLAAQMIEKLEKITAPDKTDTTITLQYPPLFKGVQVTVTEYTTSQKQFNVAFSGLTNVDARALIESQKNQDGLRAALIDKGYTLQMVTIEQKIPGLGATESLEVATEERRAFDREADMTGEEDGKGTLT